MKYLLPFLLAVALTTSLKAQEKKQAQLNFETAYRMKMSDLAINSTLANSGIHVSQNSFAPAFVGLECFVKNYSVELGLGISVNKGNRYKEVGMPTALKIKYNFEKINLSLGAMCAYEITSLSLYGNNAEIDLNSGFTSNLSQLYINRTAVGSVATYEHKLFGWMPIRWTVGYLAGIASSEWKSEYATLSAPIRENKSDMLYASASFAVTTIRKKVSEN